MRDLPTVFLLTLTLSACGQMGGLYLPEDETAPAEVVDAPTTSDIPPLAPGDALDSVEPSDEASADETDAPE